MIATKRFASPSAASNRSSRAIQKQYADFQAATGCPLALEYESLDLNPLVDTLFTRQGLKDGTWDLAFIVTDWIAEAVEAAPCSTLPHSCAPTQSPTIREVGRRR